MPQVMYVSVAVAVVLCLLCVSGALAQGPELPTPVVALNCSSVSSMPINGTLNGTWYEVVRNPQPSTPMSCVKTNVLVSGQNVSISTSYSPTANLWYMNETEKMNLMLGANNNDGANYTMTMGNGQSMITTYKLVDTDYKSYCIVCGYTNATDNSTSFGIILTKQQIVMTVNITQLEAMAQNETFAFRNTSYYIVPQSTKCTMSAASAVPIASGLMALLYAVIKFLH